MFVLVSKRWGFSQEVQGIHGKASSSMTTTTEHHHHHHHHHPSSATWKGKERRTRGYAAFIILWMSVPSPFSFPFPFPFPVPFCFYKPCLLYLIYLASWPLFLQYRIPNTNTNIINKILEWRWRWRWRQQRQRQWHSPVISFRFVFFAFCIVLGIFTSHLLCIGSPTAFSALPHYFFFLLLFEIPAFPMRLYIQMYSCIRPWYGMAWHGRSVDWYEGLTA